MQDKAVAFSKCMREHGVDMPDPVFDTGTGGGMVKISPGEKGIDPSSDAFQKAQSACGGIFGAGGKGGGLHTVTAGGPGGGKTGASGDFTFNAGVPAAGESK